MNSCSRHAVAFLLCLIIGAAVPGSASAQPGTSLADLVRETQQQSEAPGEVTIIWWLPEEFWTVSFEQNKAMSVEQKEAFLKAIRPYLLIAAVDGAVGPLGGVQFAGRETVFAGIRVRDARSKTYSPLPEEQLSADVRNLSALMRSMFATMLGPMGEGMHVFFFPSAAEDGSIIASAMQEGAFSVDLDGRAYTWRLPLGALLPRKACPVDGEKLSGAWKYCPWHGKALEVPRDTAQTAK